MATADVIQKEPFYINNSSNTQLKQNKKKVIIVTLNTLMFLHPPNIPLILPFSFFSQKSTLLLKDDLIFFNPLLLLLSFLVIPKTW